MSAQMTHLADILIIGAGIAGIGAGAFAAEAGAKVILLEAEAAAGTHASGRSAAVFIASYGPKAVRAASAASAHWFAAPSISFEAPLLTPRGILHLAYDDEGEAAIAEAGAAPLSRRDALRAVPILRPEPIRSAGFSEDAEDIDVDALMQGLLRLLRAHGGRVALKAEVTAAARRDGIWRVETPAGVFEAPVLVNAAGAWADVVAARVGAPPLGLTPKRRSAAILPAPEGCDVSRWPLFEDAAQSWYAKPTGGALMVSPADADPMPPCDIWPDDMVLAEGLDRYERAVTAPVARVVRSWAGLRSFVADGEPVIGFDPACEGLFQLAAQGGYGVQTAPALSRLAAALLTGSAETGLDAATAAALSPARLRGGAP